MGISRNQHVLLKLWRNYAEIMLIPSNQHVFVKVEFADVACTDQGGKYMSTAFSNHLAKKGTVQIAAPHDTLEYNSVSDSVAMTRLVISQLRQSRLMTKKSRDILLAVVNSRDYQLVTTISQLQLTPQLAATLVNYSQLQSVIVCKGQLIHAQMYQYVLLLVYIWLTYPLSLICASYQSFILLCILSTVHLHLILILKSCEFVNKWMGYGRKGNLSISHSFLDCYG